MPTFTGATGAAELWTSRRHPEYGTYQRHWEFLREAYIGGPAYIAPNLFRFWREPQDPDYSARLDRAYYHNLTRRIIDLFNGYLWQKKPGRAQKPPPALVAFWADADGAGHSIDEVLFAHTPWIMTFGRYFAVVDKPSVDAVTREDERRERAFPYVTFYSPLDVLDARITRGRPEWVLLRERIRDDENPQTSSGTVTERFRLWTATDWTLYEVQGNGTKASPTSVVPIDTGTHPCGRVPIVAIDHRSAESWFVSPSISWEIAYADRAVFNYLSLLDESLYGTNLAQLRIPHQALMPGQTQNRKKQEEQTEKSVVEVSLSRAFVYDARSPTAPDWIAPPSEPARVLMDRIKGAIDEVFRIAALSGELGEEVSESSGVSKEHEFRKLDKLLATQADNLERGEREIAELVMAWAGSPNIELPRDAIDYPDQFDVKTLMDDLTEMQEMAKAGLPDPVVDEAAKEYVRRRFAKLTKPEIDRLIESIEQEAMKPSFDVDAAMNAFGRPSRRRGNGAGGGSDMPSEGGGGEEEPAAT